jgi:hypothetical protein
VIPEQQEKLLSDMTDILERQDQINGAVLISLSKITKAMQAINQTVREQQARIATLEANVEALLGRTSD